MRHARQASTEGGTAGEPSGAMVRVDLHAHSRASSKGATRWLDALGAAECYSGPERVYDLALARGMGFVAITDHDTIAGAWELVERGFDRVIVGEEVTTRLCQTGCLLHILVWSMTPELHEEIARLGLRDDAEALAHWLGRHRLPHALAHPLFGLNGRLTAETLQRCALLFGGFEAINAGHSTSRHRRALGRFLASLTADRLSAWSVMFNTRPIWPARWLTAGSDDHALLNLARAWTEAPGARTAPEFFRSLMQGRASIGGSDATTETLAHQFVGVASSFVRKRAASAQRQAPNRADQSKAVDRLVLHARSAIASSRPLAAAFRLARRPSLNSDDDHRRLDGLLRAAAAAGVQQMRRALVGRATVGRATVGRATVGRASRPSTKTDPAPRTAVPLFAALAAAVVPQAPSIVAIGRQLRDRRLIQQFEEANGSAPTAAGQTSVCLFADALDHASGVSRFVRDLAADAQRSDRQLTVFTAGRAPKSFPGDVRVFPSLGDISVPGYADLRLAAPWLAEVIEASAELDPDVIHVSTPGPVGVAGALTAALLRIPLVGVHHTDYPAYAERLLGPSAAAIATKLLSLLYERFDLVLARCRASAQRMTALGVPIERVETLPAGIDLSRFGPEFRDETIWRPFPHVDPQTVKALYVGRLSKEKNLPMLVRLWRDVERRLAPLGLCAQLLVVGDGPWREEMTRQLAGLRVIFLGHQTGQTLARLYASSDLFVFPSTTETLGQVVIEAQASGLPALVADAGGPGELVLDGVTGRLLAADDEPAWVEAIVNLVRDDEGRAQMSRRAVEHARAYSFDRTAGAFWAAHERLVHTAGKTPALLAHRSAAAM